MGPWTRREYDRLFRDYPPTEAHAPTRVEAEGIGHELGRTTGAIVAQWDDARSLILGNKSAASLQLRDYLRDMGWLRPRSA
jgi:hypothetical protein